MESYRALEANQTRSSLTTDLDAFFSGIYRYYCEKGLRPVIFRSVSNLVASVFTFMLSVGVLLLIDWEGVLACTSKDVCRPFFYADPFSHVTLYRIVVLCQLVPMGLYTVVLASLSSLAKVREAIRVSEFFKSALSIPDDDMLHFLSWEEVVRKVCAYQASSESPICIVQDQLSPLEIHAIIMRSENLSLQIFKRWYSMFVEPNGGTVLGQLPLQSTAIKWCFQHTVVSWMFSDRYRIRSDLTQNFFVDKIKARIRLVGFLSAMLMGPVFIFSILLLFIKKTEDVRSNRSSLFEKEFSGLSEVVLAHFGEMPHDVSERLKVSTPIAGEFSRRIIPENPFEASLNVIKFISGGIVAVLAVTAVMHDAAVLHITIWGKNLLFHLALFSSIVGIASGMTSTHSTFSVNCKETTAKKLLSNTHYLACPHVSGNPSVDQTLLKARKLDSISSTFCDLFFKTKIVNVLYQIGGILLLPFYFLVVFPDALSDIVAETKIHRSENLGDFAAASFLVPGVSAAENIEMTSVSPNILVPQSKERTMSILVLMHKYGASSGLSKDQLVIGEKISVILPRKNSDEDFSDFFRFLVTHVSPYTTLFDLESISPCPPSNVAETKEAGS